MKSLLLVVLAAACSSHPPPKEYRLYLLAGQSNMEGYGSARDLPATARGHVPGVLIFHGNSSSDPEIEDGRGVWAVLRPGHGAGFSSNGVANQYSEHFGPELAFAAELRKLDPAVNIAIIKYARGGTSLAPIRVESSWSRGPTVTQLDHALSTLQRARVDRDLDGDGAADTLVPAGIVWMQGESDANETEQIAREYEANLRAAIGALRRALGRDDLPVVIGRISDSHRAPRGAPVWEFGGLVRRAQEAFVDSDRRAALVDTDHYAYRDAYHYDTAGTLDLGAQFARAMAALSK